MFTKIVYQENMALCIGADGRLDIYNSYDYLEEIKEHLSRTYAKELILDFSGIISVASSGLRVILEIYKMMQEQNRSFKLKNVNKEVLNAFNITGFDKFLVIENDSDNVSEDAPD